MKRLGMAAAAAVVLLASAACTAVPTPTPIPSTPPNEIVGATLAPLASGEFALANPSPPLGPSGIALVCGGVGLDATLHGDPGDPHLVWLDNTVPDGTVRVEAKWPPGYRVRFDPRAEVLDGTDHVVLRAGDPVLGACGWGADGAYLQPPFR
jgi:hypothetical protein